MGMEKWLDMGAAALALMAAVFWFLSAYGKFPPMVNYWGSAPPTDPFYQAVKFSAEMNRWAAGFSVAPSKRERGACGRCGKCGRLKTLRARVYVRVCIGLFDLPHPPQLPQMWRGHSSRPPGGLNLGKNETVSYGTTASP